MRPRPGARRTAATTPPSRTPAGGAVQYIHALLPSYPRQSVSCGGARHRDRPRRARAHHAAPPHPLPRIVSSAPLPQLARICGIAHDPSVFSSNKVLVFNLGFDAQGPARRPLDVLPDRAIVFYRVGWYDNILPPQPDAPDRMSLYVEIGAASDTALDVDTLRARVLGDLRREGIVTDHRPDLAPPRRASTRPTSTSRRPRSPRPPGCAPSSPPTTCTPSVATAAGTYCSIEDNLIETRQLGRARRAAGRSRRARPA